MYPFAIKSLLLLRRRDWSGVGPNVVYLGFTSLLTDISSEMVTAVLPVYIVFALHLSPLQFGVVDGIYRGASALTAVAGGWLSDRLRRHREVATTGYAVSAVCKLGLLAAGNVWGLLAAVIALDRVGKGLRTAPRDALISLSSDPRKLGLAFGVHRAFDTAGALAGPILAFVILSWLPGAYDVVFVVSFAVAMIGVASIALLVRNRTSRGAGGEVQGQGQEIAFVPVAISTVFRSGSFNHVLAAGCLLGLVTVADSFFYLILQRKGGVAVADFPLLYSATAVTYLVFAIPAGRWADKIGRFRVFLIGHVALLAAYVTMMAADGGGWVGLIALGSFGLYYACTDGALMAEASGHLSAEVRSIGLAVLATATSASRMLGSITFGAAWQHWGMERALEVFSVALAVGFAVAAWLWRRRPGIR